MFEIVAPASAMPERQAAMMPLLRSFLVCFIPLVIPIPLNMDKTTCDNIKCVFICPSIVLFSLSFTIVSFSYNPTRADNIPTIQ